MPRINIMSKELEAAIAAGKCFEFEHNEKPYIVHACTKCGHFPEPKFYYGSVVWVCNECGKSVFDSFFWSALFEWNRINPVDGIEQ